MSETNQLPQPAQLVHLHQVVKEAVEYTNHGVPFSPLVAEFIRQLNDRGNDGNKVALQVFNANRAARMHKLMTVVDRLEDDAIDRSKFLEFKDLLDLLKHLSDRADKEFELFRDAISDDPKRSMYGSSGPPSIIIDARSIQIGSNRDLEGLDAEDRSSIRSLFDGLKKIGHIIRQNNGQPEHTADRARAPGVPGSLKARRPE